MSRLGQANPMLGGPSSLVTPVDTLDNYFDGRSPDPDALLIDVEGFETSVLSGARALLSRTIGRILIIVEMHPGLWSFEHSEKEDVKRLLDELGLHARPLSGQSDPLAEYGSVELVPIP